MRRRRVAFRSSSSSRLRAASPLRTIEAPDWFSMSLRFLTIRLRVCDVKSMVRTPSPSCHQAVDLSLDLEILLAGPASSLRRLAAPGFLVVPATFSKILMLARMRPEAFGSSGSSGRRRSSRAGSSCRGPRSRSSSASLEHHGVLAQRLVDPPLALLDALSDLDLALAVEKRYGPHLAQVHAHRVVRLLVGRRPNSVVSSSFLSNWSSSDSKSSRFW